MLEDYCADAGMESGESSRQRGHYERTDHPEEPKTQTKYRKTPPPIPPHKKFTATYAQEPNDKYRKREVKETKELLKRLQEKSKKVIKVATELQRECSELENKLRKL